jgi:hypothetical protein
MLKEDTENPDKEIIDLIVELRENQTQLVLMKKVFQVMQSFAILLWGFLGLVEPQNHRNVL